MSQQGKWVTLHIQHLGGGEDRTLLGYLANDHTTPGYRLTRLAITKEGYSAEHGGPGKETVIHEGLWIVAPQFVWMIEYEEAAPIAGFLLDSY